MFKKIGRFFSAVLFFSSMYAAAVAGSPEFNSGVTQYQGKQYIKAYLSFNKALSGHDPVEVARAEYFMGLIAFDTGKKKEALEHLSRALDSGMLCEKENKRASRTLNALNEQAAMPQKDTDSSQHKNPWFFNLDSGLSYTDGIPVSSISSVNGEPVSTSDMRAALHGRAGYCFDLDKLSSVTSNLSLNALDYFDEDDSASNYLSSKFSLRLSTALDRDWSMNVEPVGNFDFSGGNWASYASGGGGHIGVTGPMAPKWDLTANIGGLYQSYEKNKASDGMRYNAAFSPRYHFDGDSLVLTAPLSLGCTDTQSSRLRYTWVSLAPVLVYTYNETHRFKVSAGYACRQYNGKDTVQTNLTRQDDIWSVGGGYQLSVTRVMALNLGLNYQETLSCLDRYNDYTTLASIKVNLYF